MPSARAVAWVDRLIWIYIFGGMFAIALGIETLGRSLGAGWALIVGGAVFTVAGLVLIWVRTRMRAPG